MILNVTSIANGMFLKSFNFVNFEFFSRMLGIRDPETPEVSGQGEDTGYNFRHA
ncbi:hypothetical protein GIHI108528_10455 [Gillisia hiemivivida]